MSVLCSKPWNVSFFHSEKKVQWFASPHMAYASPPTYQFFDLICCCVPLSLYSSHSSLLVISQTHQAGSCLRIFAEKILLAQCPYGYSPHLLQMSLFTEAYFGLPILNYGFPTPEFQIPCSIFSPCTNLLIVFII